MRSVLRIGPPIANEDKLRHRFKFSASISKFAVFVDVVLE
jgi:hypothetical protein